MTFPHIAITSYLGPFPDRRAQRLQNHIKQRKTLKKLFPDLSILSICSDYSTDENMELLNHGFECRHFRTQKHKSYKKNRMLKSLYDRGKGSILFLDDDVVPIEVEEFDTDPVKVLTDWLLGKVELPASCIFFACKGLIYDTYYAKRDVDIVQAPLKVTGWATLISHDLGVYNNQVALEEDLSLRIVCAVRGKEVVKHQRLFFKTFQSASGSSLHETFDDRKESIAKFLDETYQSYPHLFDKKQKGIQPVWRCSQKKAKQMEEKGLLIRTDYGYVPNEPALRRHYRNRHKGFFDD